MLVLLGMLARRRKKHTASPDEKKLQIGGRLDLVRQIFFRVT